MGKKEENKSSPSREFLERSKLIEKDLAISKEKHKMKMEEFAYHRESDRLHHERELTRGRIRSAEIRKAHERKLSDPRRY